MKALRDHVEGEGNALRNVPEFGSDRIKTMIVVRALYGLKSSGAAFLAFLAEHLGLSSLYILTQMYGCG